MQSAEPVVRGARARARLEVTLAIKDTARRQLAAEGASGLSLRAVARELGMVSSAVYRYFPSRDDLLTALIIDAYDDIGAAAEVGMASGLPDDPTGRWLGLCGGVRRWALHHPAEYALVYGSPVPGYAAPQDTIGPATRVSLAMVRLVVETAALHGLAPTPPLDDVPPPAALLPDLDAMRATLDTDLSDGVFLRGLAARTHLFGAITFELFGQHQNLISDNEAFFLHAMRLTARMIGLPIAGGAS